MATTKTMTTAEKRLRNRSICCLYTPPPYRGFSEKSHLFSPTSRLASPLVTKPSPFLTENSLLLSRSYHDELPKFDEKRRPPPFEIPIIKPQVFLPKDENVHHFNNKTINGTGSSPSFSNSSSSALLLSPMHAETAERSSIRLSSGDSGFSEELQVISSSSPTRFTALGTSTPMNCKNNHNTQNSWSDETSDQVTQLPSKKRFDSKQRRKNISKVSKASSGYGSCSSPSSDSEEADMELNESSSSPLKAETESGSTESSPDSFDGGTPRFRFDGESYTPTNNVLNLARQFQTAFARQELQKHRMTDVNQINDIDQLNRMLEETGDEDQRRPIRKRLLELKKKRREETEKNLQDLAARRENRISTKQSEGDAQKDRYMKTYDEMSKTGKFNTDKYSAVVPEQHLPSPDASSERLLRPRQLYPNQNNLNQGALAQLGQRIQSAPSMATTQNGTDPGQPVIRSPSGIKDALLKWCQVKTKGYPNVNVTNFSSAWADGMAFCALIHHFAPDSFDFKILDPRNRRANFDLAFKVAEECCGIVPLLETEDMLMMGNKPDYKCVFTYVQSIYKRFRNQD